MHRKKPEQKENIKRARILETAQRLFIEQGYAEVSMDALAHAVPVSKPTLYNHFEDKKALLIAVMVSRCVVISESVQEILLQDDRNIESALTKIGMHFLSVVLNPEAIGIYRTAITQVPHFPDLGKLFYESGPLRCKEIFANYLEKLHARGDLHIPNAKRASELFFSMLVGRMQMRLLLGIDAKIGPKEIKEHTQYVVGVFLMGQRPAKRQTPSS